MKIYHFAQILNFKLFLNNKNKWKNFFNLDYDTFLLNTIKYIAMTSTTTSLKNAQRCLVYCILGRDTICSQNGNIFTFVTDEIRYPFPICTYLTTTTSSKAIPSISKIVTTTTATSTKIISSSTKIINRQNCPRYTANTQS